MTSGVDAKLLKSTKFPPEYSKKVDVQKVNLEVMKTWIAQKVEEILGKDDDVVIDFIYGMLEENRFPDPRKIQLNITGFLEKETPAFAKQMWNLLLSAQSNSQGVPTELLEKKKEELRQQKVEAEKAAEQQRLLREKEEAKERAIGAVRQREREEREGREGRQDRVDRRGSAPIRDRGADRLRRSATPPSRARVTRRDDFSPPRGGRRERFVRGGGSRRETDTYIPSRRETYRHDFDDREGRGHRYGYESRVRSPPRRSSARDSYNTRDHRPRRRTTPPGYRRSRKGYTGSRSRSRSRSVSHRRSHGSRDHGARRRNRSYTPSSYSESSSPSSRSDSKSSYESSRSRSRSTSSRRASRKEPKNRSVSSERHNGSTRTRHKSHADTKERRDRSPEHEKSRRRSVVSVRERDRERTPTAGKRQRSVSADQVTKKRSKDGKYDETEQNDEHLDENEIDPKRRESILREKLLREKIKRSRRASEISVSAE